MVDPNLLDLVTGLVEACCIQNFDTPCPEHDKGRNVIARGARHLADNRPLRTNHRIYQATLAHVGLTDDQRLDAVVEQGVVVLRLDQILDFAGERPQVGRRPGLVLAGQILLRKIDIRFQMRHDAEQLFRELAHLSPDGAVELPLGGLDTSLGAGMDQVGDRFGLAQVHLPVQEGGSGELARLGGPAAPGEEVLHDVLNDQGIAVAGDFQHVLAGERSPFAEIG